MELEQFVKDALIAIQKGCQEGATDKMIAWGPSSVTEGVNGIEFDLAIRFVQGKISVIGIWEDKGQSRLRFSVPIANKS